MQKVDEVYSGMESSESYCFLNLTLQEYLAAYYCSLQNTAERLQKMLLLPSPLEHFLSCYCYREFSADYRCHLQIVSESPDRRCRCHCHCHHQSVVIFTVGLTKLSWDDKALSRILETSKNYSPILLSTMHLLYEAQSPDLIRQTFSSLNLDIPATRWTEKDGLLNIPKSDFSLDLFVTGYCIPHSNRSFLLETTCEENLEALSKGLDMSSKGYCSIGHIIEMRMHFNDNLYHQ